MRESAMEAAKTGILALRKGKSPLVRDLEKYLEDIIVDKYKYWNVAEDERIIVDVCSGDLEYTKRHLHDIIKDKKHYKRIIRCLIDTGKIDILSYLCDFDVFAESMLDGVVYAIEKDQILEAQTIVKSVLLPFGSEHKLADILKLAIKYNHEELAGIVAKRYQETVWDYNDIVSLEGSKDYYPDDLDELIYSSRKMPTVEQILVDTKEILEDEEDDFY